MIYLTDHVLNNAILKYIRSKINSEKNMIFKNHFFFIVILLIFSMMPNI